MNRYLNLLLLAACLLAGPFLSAQIVQYPWPSGSELVNNSKYDIKARTFDPTSKAYGPWQDLKTLLSTQRSYDNHWKVGDDAGTDFMDDRSLSFASFAFIGAVEMEVTQKLSAQKARRVEIVPQGFGIAPHFFDGNTVRFMMYKPEYVSVHFEFGNADQSINRDSNRASGFDIKHGCMIFSDIPEAAVTQYAIPDTNSPGVVVWNNNTDLSVIRNADVIYFPAGEHEMRYHKDRWETTSSWDQADAVGNWVTTQAQYDNAPLYRGRLNLGKDNQRVYLAPGAIVYGGFHSDGYDNNWLYGRGIVTGRKHLMHEIIRPNSTIPINDPYIKVTQTKEAFVAYGTGAVYDGPIFLEAWHHTCPSGQNSRIRRLKIIGWCSNNDGIRPGSGSQVDQIFIKTSDDYDYARDAHTVRNSVIWPMVNGAVGQMGWNNLGSGFAEYYDMHVIHSEWHLGDFSKTNIGILCGGKADASIKLQRNILSGIHIEDPTNYLIAVALEGNSNTAGFLKDFTIQNITTEYPFQSPAGGLTKQELRGKNNTWVENWRFTNVFVDGVLITWDNYQDYFNLNLTGTNGNNTDANAKTRNILFDTQGAIYTISYSHNAGGVMRPGGADNEVQIAAGMDQVIHIVPDDGFRIGSITVDGVMKYQFENESLQERRPSWKFESISADHSIEVVFEQGNDFFDLSNPGVLSDLDPKKTGRVKIFPNPAIHELRLELPGKEPAEAIISDLQGRRLMAHPVVGGAATLSVSSLPSGMYQLMILQNDQQMVETFVKQ